MPPKPLVDLEALDTSQLVAGPEQIRQCNRQRFEMEQLDGIVALDTDEAFAVGFKDVGEDEFWVRGHIPGRPLLPGVLMCEAAAQLSSFLYGSMFGAEKFLGFGGLEGVKFRSQVVPGDRLVLVARAEDIRPRRVVCRCQGFVGDRMVYEGTIIGMPM
jgi:3-hydroxyacyl-[acyl-carrier-protein] dehydratase